MASCDLMLASYQLLMASYLAGMALHRQVLTPFEGKDAVYASIQKRPQFERLGAFG